MNTNNIPVGAVVQWTDGIGFQHTETVHEYDGDKIVKGGTFGFIFLREICNLKVIKPLIVDKEKIKKNLRNEFRTEEFRNFFKRNEIAFFFDGGDTKVEDFLTQMVDRLLA